MNKVFNFETEYHKGEIIKTGVPCFWEQGGFNRKKNKGNSIIVADLQGNPKKPIFIKTKGSLCNGKHALFPVAINDLLIQTDVKGEITKTTIFKIIDIVKERQFLETEEINMTLPDAINKSIEKALCCNCKEVKFMRLI